MKLVKYRSPDGSTGCGVLEDDHIVPIGDPHGAGIALDRILESADPVDTIFSHRLDAHRLRRADVHLLPPIDQQEVWAAGVTYQRSQAARMEESEAAASCYDRVYRSPRPELFFKATPHRVSVPGEPLRIRADAKWSVPEPELALVLTSRLRIAGYTIGNDMSSRDIEGENPLYLPQAKVHNQCCGLGPCVTLPEGMPDRDAIGIGMRIIRHNATAFSGHTTIARMARTFEDLVGWLGRDNRFPHGAFLLTGTGIVPDSSFTLEPGDVVVIHVDGIGELRNPIVQDSPTIALD